MWEILGLEILFKSLWKKELLFTLDYYMPLAVVVVVVQSWKLYWKGRRRRAVDKVLKSYLQGNMIPKDLGLITDIGLCEF